MSPKEAVRLQGAVLRTRDGVKLVFVSPGHKIDVDTALRLTLACTTRYRIPEPTRLAHLLVIRMRRRLASA
ncbi:MAG: endonuclease V [Deltaproteobacteria bacterium]|nr:endonuclease V [Deltaproteobacteria bacterium]MDP3029070.1 endonuclease V [Deltaproteobacteria bacterium]